VTAWRERPQSASGSPGTRSQVDGSRPNPATAYESREVRWRRRLPKIVVTSASRSRPRCSFPWRMRTSSSAPLLMPISETIAADDWLPTSPCQVNQPRLLAGGKGCWRQEWTRSQIGALSEWLVIRTEHPDHGRRSARWGLHGQLTIERSDHRFEGEIRAQTRYHPKAQTATNT